MGFVLLKYEPHAVVGAIRGAVETSQSIPNGNAAPIGDQLRFG